MESDHLLCQENLACFEDYNNIKGKGIQDSGRVSGDNDYIRKLLHREISTYVNDGLQLQNCLKESWIRRPRLDGIHYIVKKSVPLGFTFQTTYTAVAYLDKFMSKISISQENSWAMRLLSVACLSLAAKMEEVSVVPLSELCMDEYSFESCAIQRMELLVLRELGWTMGFITPFSFIDYFADKLFDCSSTRNAGDSSIELVVLGATKDVKITRHKPSVIAAAATLFVIDQDFTIDALHLRIEPLASSLSLDIENIMTCYYQIRELEIETSNIVKCIESPDISPIQLQRSDPYVVASTAKRKRLAFNQNDNQFDGALHDKKGKL